MIYESLFRQLHSYATHIPSHSNRATKIYSRLCLSDQHIKNIKARVKRLNKKGCFNL